MKTDNDEKMTDFDRRQAVRVPRGPGMDGWIESMDDLRRVYESTMGVGGIHLDAGGLRREGIRPLLDFAFRAIYALANPEEPR